MQNHGLGLGRLFIEHIQQVFQGLSQTRSNWNFHGVLLLGIHPQKFDESRVYISLHFYMSIFHGSQMPALFFGLQHITRPFGNLQALGGGKGASSIQGAGQWMDGCELRPPWTPSSRVIMWMMWDGLPGYKKAQSPNPPVLDTHQLLAWRLKMYSLTQTLMCKSNHLLAQAWYGPAKTYTLWSSYPIHNEGLRRKAVGFPLVIRIILGDTNDLGVIGVD